MVQVEISAASYVRLPFASTDTILLERDRLVDLECRSREHADICPLTIPIREVDVQRFRTCLKPDVPPVKAAEGAGIGRTIGGTVGAVLAVLAATAVIAVPGIGLVAAGPSRRAWRAPAPVVSPGPSSAPWSDGHPGRTDQAV